MDSRIDAKIGYHGHRRTLDAEAAEILEGAGEHGFAPKTGILVFHKAIGDTVAAGEAVAVKLTCPPNLVQAKC